jgi:hypothetical protein
MRTLPWTLLALVALSTACGKEDEGPTGPSSASLDGTWRATRAEFVSLAPPTRSVEVIANGMTVTLQLPAAGNYTLTLTEPGAPAQVITGTWTASKDELTLNLSAPFTGEIQFDYVLTGGTLAIRGGHMPFTFDDNVGPEESIVNMTLVRQP